MKTKDVEHVTQVALNYVKAHCRFENVRVVSVDELSRDDPLSPGRSLVKVELSHSAREVERLVFESDANEADVIREFLQGAFTLILVIRGDAVESSDWENIDIC